MTIADPPFALPAVETGAVPPLKAGDDLDQPTFQARHAAMPRGTRAELIEGIVYMPPPPVGDGHSTPHGGIVYRLSHYKRFTPGVQTSTHHTTVLGDRSQPQPDAALRIQPGGQTRLTSDGYGSGCPELVCEVANGTTA